MHLTRKVTLPLGLAALAALGLASGRPAAAQNLVTNGGFETGDFTGWNVTAPPLPFPPYDSSASVSALEPHTGTYSANFGAEPPDGDVLSQTLATQVGETYTLTFFAQTPLFPNPPYISPGTGQPNTLSVLFGGVSLTPTPIDVPDSPLGSFEEYTFNVTATATASVLEFDISNTNDYTQLDDISVTPVPEPSSAAPFAVAGLGVLGLMVTARRRSAVCA